MRGVGGDGRDGGEFVDKNSGDKRLRMLLQTTYHVAMPIKRLDSGQKLPVVSAIDEDLGIGLDACGEHR